MPSLVKAGRFIRKILTSSTALLTASLVAATVSHSAQPLRRAQNASGSWGFVGSSETAQRRREDQLSYTAEIPFEKLFKAGLVLSREDMILLDEIAFAHGGYDAIRLWDGRDANALNSMDKKERHDYLVRLEHEPLVGALLTRTIFDQNGLFHKFVHRFKSPSSVYEALHLRPNGPKSLEAMSDLIRYSVLFEARKYTDSTLNTLRELKNQGFELISLWNAWSDDHYPYNAVNTVLQDPKGSLIEVQFHTPQGAFINDSTHKAYEKRRQYPKNSAQYQKLLKEQFSLASLTKTPPHVELLRTFNHQSTKVAKAS